MRRHLLLYRHQRGIRALATTLLALALLSACGGLGASAPTPDSGAPAPTDALGAAPTDAVVQPNPAGDAGAVTIGFAAQEFERQQYEPLIAAFNAQNPDIKVQFVPIGGPGTATSIDQLIRQIVGAADTAAVFFLQPEDIANGLVRDLKPLIEADSSFERDDFYPGALAPSGANDGIYLLPRTLRISLLSYNKDLWARRGLPPPKPDWTWSDLLAAAEQLAQKRGDSVDVYGLAEGSGGLEALRGLLTEAGVGTTPAPNRHIQLDQPQVAQALDRVAALAKSGALYRSTGSADRLPPEAFLKLIADQQIAMWFGAPVIIGPNVPKPTFETGSAPLPPSGAADFGAEGYIMSSGTTHPDAAWRWLSFLSRQQVQQPFAGANIVGSVPARKSLAERSGYWKQLDAETKAAVETTLARHESPLASLASFESEQQISQVLSQALDAVVSGKQSATQALAAAQATLDQQVAEALSTPSPTPDTAPIVVATPAPSGPAPGATTIAFNVPLFQAEQFHRLANEFNQQHPELYIDVKSVQLDDQMTLARMAAGADCFAWPDPAAASHISGTLDLQPLIDADGAFAIDDYPATLLAPFQRGTALYGLPYQLQLRALTYNKEAFDAAGLSYPDASWTADDLLNAAKQLTSGADDDKRYGYAALGTQIDDLLFFLRLLGAQVTRDGAPNFNDPKVGQAARFYLDQLRNYSPHKQINGYTRSLSIGGETFQLVQNGRVGMWFDLPGGIQIIRVGPGAEGRQNYTRVLAPPPGAGQATPGSFETSGLYISAGTQQLEACWQWLKFLSADLSTLGNNFPARRSLAESADFTKKAPEGAAAVYAAYRPALNRAPASAQADSDRPQVDMFWFFRAVDRALQGGDLDRELSDAQAKTEQYLACVHSGGTAGTCAKQVDSTYEGFAGSGGSN
jgi:ABC-type glycerol-3-phosphate transport system substrate-binding protein